MDKEERWLLTEKYFGKETPEFLRDRERLRTGEPLAYVIGWTDFLSAKIDLSQRPLIPRTETEFWVEKVIAEVGSQKSVSGRNIKILDLFAGSGCIGIALLKHVANATVDFGEIDPALCEQIQINIDGNAVDRKRTKVIQTDVFVNINDTYDIIVANPPYIDRSKKNTVQHSVLAHEQHTALFADDGGLSLVKRLVQDAPNHLENGGILYFEFGDGQKDSIEELLKGGIWTTEFWKDQYDRWRTAKLILK